MATTTQRDDHKQSSCGVGKHKPPSTSYLIEGFQDSRPTECQVRAEIDGTRHPQRPVYRNPSTSFSGQRCELFLQEVAALRQTLDVCFFSITMLQDTSEAVARKTLQSFVVWRVLRNCHKANRVIRLDRQLARSITRSPFGILCVGSPALAPVA